MSARYRFRVQRLFPYYKPSYSGALFCLFGGAFWLGLAVHSLGQGSFRWGSRHGGTGTVVTPDSYPWFYLCLLAFALLVGGYVFLLGILMFRDSRTRRPEASDGKRRKKRGR